MTVRLDPITPGRVAAVWPHIAAWVESVAARFPPWARLADPKARCEARDAQLWLIRDGGTIKGCVITQITVDNERVAEVPLVAGDDMASWLHLLDDLEAWARREGCVAMVSTAGREGWVRTLKNLGWQKVAVLMERRL